MVVGGKSTKTRELEVDITLRSLDGSTTIAPFKAVTAKTVVAPLPAVRLDTQQFDHLKDINFTESYPQENDADIDILVDVDVYLDMMRGEIVKSDTPHEPKVIITALGNVLGGAYIPNDDYKPRPPPPAPAAAVVATATKEMEVNFKAFMGLEDIGCVEKDGKMSAEDTEAVRLMEKLTYYDKEKKQYVTGLLWKHRPEEMLDSNYTAAKQITLSAKRKSIQHKKEEQVNAAYLEQIEQGFAEKVPEKEARPNHATYCIPTHPVYKPGSETTKCRIVMNASSKCRTTGHSLNDCLYQGPTLLPDLVHLLLKFRLYRFVTVCDISKMFWKIRINPPDADCLRFLWQWKEMDPVSLYRALSVTFGVISAPFQAIWTVLFHCDNFEEFYPLAAKAIKQTLYMDDASALNNLKELAIETARQIYELFQAASMQPHKWNSNDKEILREAKIPEEFWAKREIHKILGVQWDTDADTIEFDFSQIVDNDGKQQTKRTLLQQAARIFDPLGLIAPFTLKAKLLLQQCWKEELDWDAPLTEEIEKEWNEWRAQVAALGKLNQPRIVALSDSEAWLACFADASAFAYGACIYLVQDNKPRLLIAKTRVAPLKTTANTDFKMTIARLELLASMIATRLVDYVKDALGKEFVTHTRYFTDSLITLWRIRNGSAGYKVWVANRVAEIRHRSKPEEWFFVPGMLNPADMASRSATVEELLTNEFWWEGPAFLRKPEDDWPTHKALTRQEAYDQNELDKSEKRTENAAALLVEVRAAAARLKMPTGLRELFVHTSSWPKLIRKTARLIKFLVKIMPSLQKRVSLLQVFNGNTLVCSVAEVKATEKLWLIWAQREAWAEEIKEDNGKFIVKKKSDLEQYNVIVDTHGLLRSQTRLELSETLPGETTTPILLPKRDEIIEKFVLHLHKLHGHVKGNHMLYIIRQQFRLIGGKREMSRIIHLCMKRGCQKPIPLEQKLAPLPPERLDDLVTYQNIAVDIFGPFQIKHQCSFKDHTILPPKKQECPHEEVGKAWGVIFTCLQSRAVHLELVEDMSTTTFLRAFSRMCSRRGEPSFVWSDNAKTFKSANRLLTRLYKKLDWREVHDKSAAKGIQWKFGVEKAPHTNGVVERMIRSVKDAMKTTLAAANISARHLETIMIEVEGLVNDRPLVAPSEDDNDPATVTPNKLCIGRSVHLMPMVEINTKPGASFTKMQRYRRELINKFWNRWRKDYMLQQQASKYDTSKEPILQKGQIVLLREENLNRGKWRLAKVLDPVKGRDGRIRRVKLKTQQGLIDRHINQLALLEGSSLLTQQHAHSVRLMRHH